MRVLLMNKKTTWIAAVSLMAMIIAGSSAVIYQPVYKNRSYWERTGDIVWEGSTSYKKVALTFDDGPSPTFTEQILDILKAYNAKVTFFVIGKRVEMYPEIVRRQHREGHEIGNHTYEHREVNRLSAAELEDELRRADQAIKEVIGKNARVFRPTSGYYDEKIVRVANKFNYSVIIWTWGQDTRDWAYVKGWRIAQKVIKNVKPGDIILFHDQGGDRSNTVEALKILLPALSEKGYKFVTLTDLLNLEQKHMKSKGK